jgi:hypothetical protein
MNPMKSASGRFPLLASMNFVSFEWQLYGC